MEFITDIAITFVQFNIVMAMIGLTIAVWYFAVGWVINRLDRGGGV